MVTAHFKEVEVKILVLVPVTFLAIQMLAFNWSFDRGNRRIALRVMHLMTFISLLLCSAVILLN